jgi:CheY-like chemotaxis protein
MSTIEKSLRVLIVDDNRDGADSLGLLVEALGNQVHVTYGGIQALDVASAFQPDLMLIDLVMPDIDGCDLTSQLRRMPAFKQTKIVAITGLKDEKHKVLAMKAGCDLVLRKPAALNEIKAVLASVDPAASSESRTRKLPRARVSSALENRLPIDAARRIRSDRVSKSLTQTESEAAICDGIIRFQEEYLGWRSDQVQIHFVKELLVVRIRSVLTLAERQLGKTASPEKGRDLIKQTRKQLLELARPMLESLVYEAVGVKVRSMHHDISTVSGEEVIVFSLDDLPRFE